MPDPVTSLVLAIIVLAIAALMFRFLVWPSWQEAGVEQDAESDTTMATEVCRLYDQSGRRVRHACGHDAHARYKIELWGRTAYVKRGLRAGAACGDCTFAEFKRVSKRCCDCGHAIVPGQMVKMCADGPEYRSKPEWKTAVNGHLLGCLKGPCFGEGYRMCGWWTENGYLPCADAQGPSRRT